MRSGFTLIEIMIAAAITSIVGMALLAMSNNTTHLFNTIKSSSNMAESLSLIGAHGDLKYNHTEKTLYDILDKSYTIDNDELRRFLQKSRYSYNEKVIDTITFGEDGEIKEDDNTEQEELNREDLENQAPLIQFELIQISIKNPTSKGYILQVRPI